METTSIYCGYEDMSSRVKRQGHILQALAKAHPHVCKAILRGADKDLLQCLSECAHNVILGNVPLTTSQKAQLTKYKRQLRNVANKKTALKKKVKLVQTGGFLPALLAPLLGSIITPLTKAVIKGFKKKKRKSKPKHG